MLTFVIRRLLVTIPMLLVISFLVYLGLELTPGDAVSQMIDPESASRMSPEQFEQMREALGLNKSFVERYGIWLYNIMQGDFGRSLSGGVPISTIVLDRLPATLELSIFALVFSTIFGCILGTMSAHLREDRRIDPGVLLWPRFKLDCCAAIRSASCRGPIVAQL